MYYSYCDMGLRDWKKIERQIQKPNTTIDSIIKIFKSETNIIFPKLEHLNKVTYNSLLSTGDIELFQEEHLVMLMDFYAIREDNISALIGLQEQEVVRSSSYGGIYFFKNER